VTTGSAGAALDLAAGRVVRFRDRVWRVDTVEDGTFTATPLDGRDLQARRFVAAVERIEDGALPFPEPSRTTDPTEQDLLLRAYQLALVHGAAPIVGLQRSRAIPTPYQIVPLLMALGEGHVRLLIADDVGIGKTIEAGLVLSELLARRRTRRVLIVAPWNLTEQWREALEHFFHLEGTIVATHLMPALERRLLPGQSPWEAHDICIASVDYLKLHRHAVLQYPWDMAIVDEAHMCARPHAAAGQAPRDMLRWEFANDLAARVKHMLLLTATPHSGYTDSYASLLSMLHPALVTESPGGPQIKRRTAERHVCQRRRRDIEEWFAAGANSPFPRRDQHEVVIDPSKPQQELLKALRDYTDELDELAERAPMNAWVAAHLQKRALSSPEALRQTIQRRIKKVKSHPESEQTARDRVEAEIEVTDDLAGEGLSDEERSARIDGNPTTLEASAELRYLERIAELAAKVRPAQDAKLKTLRELLPRRADAHETARRAIVFTRYKDTLDYLAKHLKAPGFEVFLIYGELSATERRTVFAGFSRSERAVLIATDCISEGLNLQRAAAEIVHYELPWNPNRLEQRNGRVDRFGQPEPFVGIRTLVLDDQLDTAILELCVRKAMEIRAEFGFSPPFFTGGDSIRSLVRRHGRRRQLTLFEDEETTEEFFDRDQLERVRVDSFFGQTDISLGDVEEVLERSRAITGSPERIRTFVERALRLQQAELVYDGGGFYSIKGRPAALADVLPESGTLVTFDAGVAAGQSEVDVVDLAHPLLRRLIDVVRDRSLGAGAPGRTTGWATNAVTEVTGVVHVLARYVAGSDPPVVLEELVRVALPVWSEGSVAVDVDDVTDAPPTAEGAGYGGADIAEAAEELLGRADLHGRIGERLEALRTELSERHTTLGGDWARGLADVELASYDPVAATILFPAAAA
jgi:superfamily II DNA or RNA helicase